MARIDFSEFLKKFILDYIPEVFSCARNSMGALPISENPALISTIKLGDLRHFLNSQKRPFLKWTVRKRFSSLKSAPIEFLEYENHHVHFSGKLF